MPNTAACPFQDVPRLLITSKLRGDFELGTRIADSVAAIVGRTVRHSALYAISRADVDMRVTLVEQTPTPPPWPERDLLEYGRAHGAAAIVDLEATALDGAVRVRVRRIMPAKRAELAVITTKTVAAAAAAVATTVVADTAIPRKLWRSCPNRLFPEALVDEPPRFLGRNAAGAQPTGHPRRYDTLVKFHVDTSERVLRSSFEVVEAVDSAIIRSARSGLVSWRFDPARVGSCKVASVVLTWLQR